MIPTRQDLEQLSQQLPRLVFSVAADSAGTESPLAQAYLDYYQINFAREFPGTNHGFGQIQSGGFRIAVNYWLPPQARATVLVLHGYYDHTGIFGHPIRALLAANFAVLAFDLPGHGLSSGEPAVIDSFNQYADVLADVLQQSAALLPQPLHGFGQSTGGAVILNYLWRHTEAAVQRLDKIVLCSPLVVARGWFPAGRYLHQLLRPFVKRLGRGPARSSHDKSFNDFLMHRDCLQAKHLSLRWVGAMREWHDNFLAFEPQEKSLLILQGTGDMTVDWQYNLPLLQRKLPNARITLIENAGHQLVNESREYRDQVLSAARDYFLN
jgi:alpha-beta hydrolase superfamily lysophospholipase